MESTTVPVNVDCVSTCAEILPQSKETSVIAKTNVIRRIGPDLLKVEQLGQNTMLDQRSASSLCIAFFTGLNDLSRVTAALILMVPFEIF